MPPLKGLGFNGAAYPGLTSWATKATPPSGLDPASAKIIANHAAQFVATAARKFSVSLCLCGEKLLIRPGQPVAVAAIEVHAALRLLERPHLLGQLFPSGEDEV